MTAAEYFQDDPWYSPFEVAFCRFSSQIELSGVARSSLKHRLDNPEGIGSWNQLYQRFGGEGVGSTLKPDSALAAIAYYNSKLLVFERLISSVLRYGVLPEGEQLDRLRHPIWVTGGPTPFFASLYKDYHLRTPPLLSIQVDEYEEGSFNLINVEINIGSDRIIKFLAAAALATTIVSRADEAYENLEKLASFISQEVDQFLLEKNDWLEVIGENEPVSPENIAQQMAVVFRDEWDWSNVFDDDDDDDDDESDGDSSDDFLFPANN